MTGTPDANRDAGYDALSVDVYVRPSRIDEALDEYLLELRQLQADGVVDEVAVHSWPGRVPIRSEAGDAVDRFREFRSWADDRDVDIQPPFSVRAVASEFTGEHRTYLSTPVLCLAVEAGDAIAGVYPHTDDDVHHSIADGIDALAAGEFDRPTASDSGRDHPDGSDPGNGERSAGPNRCSECGGDVVNVQGMSACQDCPWIDRNTHAFRPAVISR